MFEVRAWEKKCSKGVFQFKRSRSVGTRTGGPLGEETETLKSGKLGKDELSSRSRGEVGEAVGYNIVHS